MNNVTFIETPNSITGAAETFAIIDNGDGSFTSMPKSEYDKLPFNSSSSQAGA